MSYSKQELAHAETIRHLYQNMYKTFIKESDEEKIFSKIHYEGNSDTRAYRYISLHSEDFLRILTHFNDSRDKSFLDIGCGLGDKLHMVSLFARFKSIEGLEFNPLLARTAKQIIGETIHNISILDFKDYNKYDCLYTYMPIASGEKMAIALEYIMEQMKQGATLYFFGAGGGSRLNTLIREQFEEIPGAYFHFYTKK